MPIETLEFPSDMAACVNKYSLAPQVRSQNPKISIEQSFVTGWQLEKVVLPLGVTEFLNVLEVTIASPRAHFCFAEIKPAELRHNFSAGILILGAAIAIVGQSKIKSISFFMLTFYLFSFS